jgi:hypothetical protein
MTRRRTYGAAATGAALLAMSTMAGGASAAATPAAPGPPSLQLPAFTFVPPRVGPISVDIGPTIINGQVVNPGLHVLKPATTITLPPMNSTPLNPKKAHR